MFKPQQYATHPCAVKMLHLGQVLDDREGYKSPIKRMNDCKKRSIE